jgi:hypothetical protein
MASQRNPKEETDEQQRILDKMQATWHERGRQDASVFAFRVTGIRACLVISGQKVLAHGRDCFPAYLFAPIIYS